MERAVLVEAARMLIDHEGELAALGGLGAELGERRQTERLQDLVEVGGADCHALCLPAAADHA